VRIALPPLHPGAITVGDAVRVFDVNRHFETLAEVGARTRMHTAVEFLARHGVTLEPRHRLTVEQVEAMVLALDDTLDQGQETNG
jgi:hypothetical protein